MKRAAIAIAVAMLAGCPAEEREAYVYIGSFTAVPPSATGSVTNDFVDGVHRVTMSVGVALAVRCADDCAKQPINQECASLRVDSDDAAVIDARPLFRNGRQSTELVLVAGKVGATTLHVQTSCGVQDYDVNVTPPPTK